MSIAKLVVALRANAALCESTELMADCGLAMLLPDLILSLLVSIYYYFISGLISGLFL
jgi:hypothetical protein